MGKLTEGEWAVLNALWTGDRLTLGEVTAALDPALRWRRNTVLTYLTRMEGKGLVTIHRQEEPHRYAAAVIREACARQERSRLLDRVYQGAAGDLIAAFLKESSISPEERDRLRKLLDDMEV
ncbi:MAG TPA: BlaI/MecI/CopY family transcriptional regulator [Candidatus Evtepia faecavium]|nr:BlaI/MecI/CopY family transcriptional regulator [Candidatus Evtepia faecavium]